MKWISKSTGDMTLAIVDENGFEVLVVNMRDANTLKAETNGSLLCRTKNDLEIIAGFAEQKCFDIDSLPYPEDGISPLPWNMSFDPQKRKLVVNSSKKKIAERVFPKRTSFEDLDLIINTIQEGLNNINNLCDN